ncbi:MAG: TIR domain-containing protein [Chloroflexota bacterium]
MSHIFISYAWIDGHKYAEKLERDLQAAGYSTWRDTRNIHPDQDFTAEIEKALEPASHVVVCMTPDIKRNDSFVRREIQYALLLKKPIIPLRFTDMLPPIHIIDFLWVDFFKQMWENAFSELQQRLNLSPNTYPSFNSSEDPFHTYLDTLYKRIVQYLDLTVFTLIPLQSKATSNMVKSAPTLLTSFFGTVLNIKDVSTAKDLEFNYFADAFRHYDGRILLLGEPGGGKTTTLMAFARDAVVRRLEDPSQPLPIIARISDWDVVKAPSLDEWLIEQIEEDLQQLFVKV